MRILRVQNNLFDGSVQELVRVLDEVLVQGVGHGDEEDSGLLVSTADAAHALVEGDERSWIADENARVQPPHIDAHLHGRRTDHTHEFALEKGFLDLPSFGRQETGPV